MQKQNPSPPSTPKRKARVPRAEREQRMARGVYISIGVAVAAVVGLLIGGYLLQFVIRPNRVLAEVRGEPITLGAFERRALLDYFLQTRGATLTQVASQSIDPSLYDPVGYQEAVQEAADQQALSFAEASYDSLIRDVIIAQEAAELGITVTDEEVEERLELTFGYDAGDPEPTVTPFPTFPPTSSPTVTPTFVYTPTPTITPTVDPTVTPTATATATPTPDPDATPTPTSTPFPTPTPISIEDYQESLDAYVEQLATFRDFSIENAQLALREYIRAEMLRERLQEELEYDLITERPQIHAAHILVETQEEALDLREQIVEDGESFEQLAADFSTDFSNAYRGGDLGWFGEGRMVEPFYEGALATEPGEVSQPVETEFGWHLIKVYEKSNVEVDEFDLQQQRFTQFEEYITEIQDAEDTVTVELDWANFLPPYPR